MADRAADEQIDDLYDLDPGEFTAARNALAKRLKGEGHKEVAATVAKLRRPTLVAWAINQVARRQPEAVTTLIETTEGVAAAQSDLLAGGEPAGLRAARTAQRAAAGVVVEAARTSAGGHHGDAITATVDAALADADLVGRLQAGTLTDTLDAPSGFGFALDADPGPTAPRRGRRAPSTTSPTKTAREDEGADDDAAISAAAAADRARLEKALEQAVHAVAAARDALEAAEAEGDEAAAALMAAQQRADHTAGARQEAADVLAAAQAEEEGLVALLAGDRVPRRGRLGGEDGSG